MNAFTNLPHMPAVEHRPAIEWLAPNINSPADALLEVGFAVEGLVALTEANASALGDLGGLGEPITPEQTTSIYMMTRLALATLESLQKVISALAETAFSDEPQSGASSQPLRGLFGVWPRDEWERLLNHYLELEARPAEGRSDIELEADGNAASAALLRLLGTRCPDLQALAEKLDVIEQTDGMMLTGTMDELRRDVAILGGLPEPVAPASEPMEAF